MGKSDVDVFISQEGDVTIAAVIGPVDSANMEKFREKIQPAFAKQGAKVLLDCSQLTYLNSRGIGLLVSYQKQLLFSRGRVAICNLNNRLVRTLELLDLGKSLPIFPSREEALAALQ